MANCYKCGKSISDTYKVMVSRSDSCPHCMADIRCCKMCQFYDPKAYNECREPNADRITEKRRQTSAIIINLVQVELVMLKSNARMLWPKLQPCLRSKESYERLSYDPVG